VFQLSLVEVVMVGLNAEELIEAYTKYVELSHSAKAKLIPQPIRETLARLFLTAVGALLDLNDEGYQLHEETEFQLLDIFNELKEL
jgi:hypothetical protein